MKPLSLYSSFVKLEHSLFSLPLLFAGALLAGQGWPSLTLTFLILVAGSAARVVALGLNRIIDRRIDSRNPRTKERHLASGKMSLLEAWALISLSLVVYLVAAWLISPFCLQLSWVPLVAFAAYPYFKRFTQWAHVGLGLVWALVPLGGFFALNPSFDGIEPVIALGAFCTFWLAGFDIIYATQDEEFDRNFRLYSLPASLGSEKALRVSAVFHILAFFSLLALYGVFLSGPLTVMLLVLIGVLLYWEQQVSSYVDMAFFKLNVVIGFGVLVFVFLGLKGY